MNRRFLTVLLFAFAVALGASALLYKLITGRMEQTAAPPTTKVLVATRDLQLGHLIKDVDIRESDFVGTPPPQAVTKKEDLVDRGVIGAIYQGELFLESRLAPKGAGAGLAATIPQGMRAVALRVNDVVGVAGFVVPGQRVDVIISGNPPNARGDQGTHTKTILQNIEVLSAGQNIQKDAEGKPVSVPVVNVLVTPEQAEVLSLASNETRIQLILRNPLDTEESKPPGTTYANLFSGKKGVPEAPPVGGSAKPRRPAPPPPPPPAAKKEAPIPIVVEVIHGTKRGLSKFEEEKDKEGSEGKQ